MTGPAQGRVVAVNVGRPRTISHEGREAPTGIVKTAVEGPVELGAVNLAGDGQADLVNHGGPDKAVYAYPVEHYAYWRDRLGGLAPGTGVFGENLTVAGLDEHAVRIGDVLAVGTVVLQVSQPRYPCWKLEWQLGRSRGFADRFVHANRTGFYLRVLRQGRVERGDAIRVVRRGASGVTVAEHMRLLALSGPADAPALRAAARSGDLMPSWRDTFAERAEALDAGRHVPGWPGLRTFVVHERTTLAADVVGLVLRPADGGPLPDFRPGQFVGVSAVGADGRPVARFYSLYRTAGQESLHIGVRKIRGTADGDAGVSAWLHDRVDVGDELPLQAPSGGFFPRGGPGRRLVLVSGGIGVTPIHAIADAVASGRVPRDTEVFHTASRPGADPLAASLRALAARTDRLRVHLHYSRPEEDPSPGPVRRLRVDDVLARVTTTDAEFLLCGPSALCREFADGLARAGVAPEDVRSEMFGRAQHASVGPVDCPPEGRAVSFVDSGREARWRDPELSLLDLAERNGVALPSSCRSGSCGTCVVRLEHGAVAYLQPPSALLAEGECLPCVAVPRSDVRLRA